MNYLKNSTPSMLLIILLIGFPQISETIYTPALPDITRSLMTSSTLVQWTLSVYFLGFAIGVFFWGRLSDRIGRRPAMLLGLVIYGVGSLGCLFSPTITWLLAARVIQAFGASVGSVITQTIIRESFDDFKRGKLFSVVGIAISLTPAIGPFIGGYVNDWFGWQANFFVLVIMSIVLLIYSSVALPETKIKNTQPNKVSLSQTAYALLTDKKVLGCTWLVAAINGILFSYYAEAPFIFIKLVGISAAAYGWLGLFIASASMLGSLISHRLNGWYSSNQIILLGCLITLISAIALSSFAVLNLISAEHVLRSILLVMLPMAGMMLGGFGLILPSTLSTALSNYKSILGTAGALFGLFYYILIAILLWIMGLLHSGTAIPMPLYFTVLSLSILAAYYFLVRKN